MVWVVIDCEVVYTKLREYINHGFLAEANKFNYALESLRDKVKAMVMSRGGSLVLGLYDCHVLQIPDSVAEELPGILSFYQEVFVYTIAVGIGLDFEEASKAAQKSKQSREIEFFGDMEKSDTLMFSTFDPKVPEPKKPTKKNGDFEAKPSLPLDAEKALDAEAKLISAMVQQLMGGQPQQQQQAQQQQPSNLMEALSGQKQQAQQQPQEEQEEPEESEQPQESSQDDEATIKTNKKLGLMLETIKQSVPALMELSNKNPQAYKQAMNIVNKVLHLAKESQKATEAVVSKYEIDLKGFL